MRVAKEYAVTEYGMIIDTSLYLDNSAYRFPAVVPNTVSQETLNAKAIDMVEFTFQQLMRVDGLTMSLVEQIDKKGVGPQHKSIIDRCVASVYREAEITGITPTLCTLREKLLEQPEPEAKQVALALELYTTGSLDIFGRGSNVDLDKRVLVFDIHGLGSQLKPAGLLVITDTILNRVTLNWKKGKRTHVFIDEFHVVFENEYSAAFFNSAWRQFRKPEQGNPAQLNTKESSKQKSKTDLSSTEISNPIQSNPQPLMGLSHTGARMERMGWEPERYTVRSFLITSGMSI